MPDYLPFERVSYRKPEINALAESVWIFFIYNLVELPPDGSTGYDVWTVPTGYRGVVADIIITNQFTGMTRYWIVDGDNILIAFHDAYTVIAHSFQLPPIAETGQTITFSTSNWDIQSGYLRHTLSVWQVPGSKPKKPKNDDPVERFMVGDFTNAHILIDDDGSAIYLFYKRKENKVNYLRIKKDKKQKHKILSSLHLPRDDLEDTIESIVKEPQKTKDLIDKLEIKYKKSIL
jgi:hypothetical protein